MPASLLSADYKHFLKELREVRQRAGLSQQQLAERMGLDQTFISKCELGVRRVDVVELRRWMAAVGQTLGGFIDGYEKRLSRNRLPAASPGRKSL